MKKLGIKAMEEALRKADTDRAETRIRTRQSRRDESDRWVELQSCRSTLHTVDLDAPSAPYTSSSTARPARPKLGFYQSVIKRHEEVRSRETAYASFYGGDSKPTSDT